MVPGQVIPNERLTSILVNSLQNLASVNISPSLHTTQASNLVSSSVSETWEEGEELATGWRSGFVFEDNGVQLGGGGNLAGSAR